MSYYGPIKTTPTPLTLPEWDINKNFSANNFLSAFTSTAASGTTLVLTAASTMSQYITTNGFNSQTIKLPVTSTLSQGHSYFIYNNSNEDSTIQSSGGNTVLILTSGFWCQVTCILTSGTSAASWSYISRLNVVPSASYAGGTVSFVNTNEVSTMSLSDTFQNIALGYLAGTGFSGNISGNCEYCTAYGNQAMQGAMTNTGGVGIGNGALLNDASGNYNTGVGNEALLFLNGGYNNTGLGNNTGFNGSSGLISGSYNLLLGDSAGSNFSASESTNIMLMSPGVSGDSNVTRIGFNGGSPSQIACYIDGITTTGSTLLTSPAFVVVDFSTGQLAYQLGASSWTGQVGNFSAFAGNSYFVSGTPTAALPTGSATGDTITFYNIDGSPLTLQAASGDSIQLGDAVSSPTGSLISDLAGDEITIVYDASIALWNTTGVVGNWVTDMGVSNNAINLPVITFNNNLIIGPGCGSSSSFAAAYTVVLGQQSFTAAGNNSSGTIVVGMQSMPLSTADNNSVIIGSNCFNAYSSGIGQNTCLGTGIAQSLLTGMNNIFVGFGTAAAYTAAESGNILIGTNLFGVGAENNITRIGFENNAPSQIGCYVDGINTVDSSGFTSPLTVYVDSATGQLGYGASSAPPPFISQGTNLFLGTGAGNNTVSGSYNYGFGNSSLNSITSGNGNACFGNSTGGSLTGGGGGPHATANTIIGCVSGNSLVTGNFNVIVGNNSGGNYTTSESNNILIGANLPGVATENFTTRIGFGNLGSPTQTRTFIDGINTVNSSGFTSPLAVFIDSATGQLGYGSSGSGRLLGLTIYNTAGAHTFTPNAATNNAIVEVLGGGGGGGGVAGGGGGTAAGGGGGSGGLARLQLTRSQMLGAGTTMQVTIGANGSGGTAGANTGSNGGDTTLIQNGGAGSNIVTAGGGLGGLGQTVSVTPQVTSEGSGGGVTVNIGTTLVATSQMGSYGLSLGTVALGVPGKGGNLPQYGAGGGGVPSTGGTGSNASGSGAGGGGAFSSTGSNFAGGDATDGIAYIWEYS